MGLKLLNSSCNVSFCCYTPQGNITRIDDPRNNQTDVIYTYDNLGQLTSEQNNTLGKSFTCTYDDAGNITFVTTTDQSTGASETIDYLYASTTWGDQLTSVQYNTYDTVNITYDSCGNMTHYV